MSMTNMKALPMLDHVMLWVARVFLAVLLLPLVVIQVIDSLTILDNWFRADHQNDVPVPGAYFFADVSLWLVLWLLCIRQMQSGMARICLGLSSSLIFLFCIYCAFDEFFVNHVIEDCLSDKIWGSVILLIAELGFGSILWASIRPPQNSNPFPHNFLKNYPLPQSC
jgi:hypothetical protein